MSDVLSDVTDSVAAATADFIPLPQAALISVVVVFAQHLLALGVRAACREAGMRAVLWDVEPRRLLDPGRLQRRTVVIGDPASLSIGVINGLNERDLPVVVIASDVACAAETVRAGARGFLEASSRGADLASAVENVHEGRFALSHGAQAAMLGARPDLVVPHLSPRELEVLRRMATGMTAGQIARDLFVTEATVKTHVKRLGSKLNERKQTGMVLRACRLGLLDQPAS